MDPSKWVNTPSCQICPTTFGLWQRPHHCRRCGFCVCAACSPFLESLKVNQVPVRVCVKCKKAIDFSFNDFLKGLGLTSGSITAFEDKKQVDYDKFLQLSRKDFDQYKTTSKMPNYIWNAVKSEQLKEIPFNVLSPDMICTIFKYLIPKDLYNVSVTGKSMTVMIYKNRTRISNKYSRVNTKGFSLIPQLVKQPDLLWRATAFDFIMKYPFNQRAKVSEQMLRQFSDSLPVIIQLDKPGYKLKKIKYLVPSDASLGRLLQDVKKQIEPIGKDPSPDADFTVQGIIASSVPSTKSLVLALYREYRQEDGLLYILAV